MSNFKKITTGLIAAATLTVAVSPADARWRGHRGYRGGGDRTALALGVGALGLGVGLALSNRNRDRGFYGDRYYGGRGGYDGYYGRPYAYGYGRGYDGYYGRPYRGGGYGYGYGRQRCWTDRQWDEWDGRWRRVRVCDRY